MVLWIARLRSVAVFSRAGMRELLHGAHDLRDAVDAFERLVERARNFFFQILEVRFADELARRFAADVDQLAEQRIEFAE